MKLSNSLKIFSILMFLLIFINLTSAVLDVKTFNPHAKNFGEIKVKDWVGISNKADYRLIDYEASVIDVWAEGEYKLYKKTHLFTGVFYKNVFGNKGNLRDVKFFIWKSENTTFYNPIYENQNCRLDFSNSTNGTQICDSVLINNNSIIKDTSHWVEYEKGMDLESSEGRWRLEAKRKPNKRIDFILEAHNKEFTEWAWFNDSWNFKREISNLTGNISALFSVNYSANMKSDFSDLRFTDSTETFELNYTIENYSASSNAQIRVNNLGENAIFMYYGNGVASYNGNATALINSPIAGYYMDIDSNSFTNSYNLTTTGASISNTSYIGNSFDFTGTSINKYLKSTTSAFADDSITFSFWINPNGTTGAIYSTDGGAGYSKISIGNTGGGTCSASKMCFGRFVSSSWGNVQSTASTGTGAWEHWVVTIDGTNITMYKNGVLDSSQVIGKPVTVPSNIVIGNLGWGQLAGTNFNGYIDEFNVFNRIITEKEIYNLYTYTAPNFIEGAEQEATGRIEVDFVTPPTPTNNTQTTNPNITVEVNATYTNSSLINISYDIYNINGTETNYFFTNETYQINITLPDGNFNYNVTIYGNETINDSIVSGSTETRYLTIDSTPPIINLTSPNGTYTYLKENYSLDLNWSVSDLGEGLDSCWFVYQSNQEFLNCSANYTTFNYSTGINSLTFFANDTFGNIQNESTSWDYKLLEVATDYENETIEGNFETFTLHLQKGDGISAQSVVLNYNGTQYSTSLYTSGENITAISNIIIPSIEADANKSFYFTVTLSDASVFNTTEYTQLVQNVAIDDCSSQPNLFMTLNLVDEENQSAINGEIEIYMSIVNSFDYGEVLNFSGNYSSISSKTFCSNLLLNETTFLLDSEIRYDSDNHSAEFYNIQKSNLSLYPKEFILYDLKDDDTTKFKLIYRNDDLIGVEGAIIQLQRKYISEGVFKIVEAPLTSSESTAIVHIDTNTHLYQATVVKDGEVLNIFENLAFVCQSELTGECYLDLSDYLTPPNSVSIESIQDFSYSLDSDTDNKTITIDFSVPSGTTSEIRVVAMQTDIIGTETICNQSVSSAGGSVDCSYNSSIDDSYIDYYVYKDNLPIIQKTYLVKDDLRGDFEGDNYFILIIFAISLIFMGLLSPEWIILNAIISIIVGAGTWLIRGMDFVLGLGAIAWLLLAGIVIIIKMSKQEDQ